jgi:cytochrome c biogenesis factor
MLGALISTNAAFNYSVRITPDLNTKTGSGLLSTDGKTKLLVKDIQIAQNFSELNFQITLAFTIIDASNSTVIQGALLISEHARYGRFSKVFIVSSLLTDYYATIENIQFDKLFGKVEVIFINVKIIPLISLVWIGGIVLFVSMTPLIIFNFLDWKRLTSKKQ